MSDRISRARHRAARRPLTPLTDLATAATDNLGVAGRRTAVAVASSGLVVSMLGAPSSADEGQHSTLSAVDVDAVTAAARAALQTAPVVSSPSDAKWSFDVPKFEVVADPEPVVTAAPATTPAPQRSESASRGETRAEAPVQEPAPAAVPQSVSGNAILEVASRYVGVPYVYGGASPSGFDCSGFTSYVYAQVGISLPRTSSAQRAAGTVVSRSEAKPGDLIFSPGHIGIYAGGDQQIDAPRPGKTIQFRSIWQSNPTFVRYTG